MVKDSKKDFSCQIKSRFDVSVLWFNLYAIADLWLDWYAGRRRNWIGWIWTLLTISKTNPKRPRFGAKTNSRGIQ